MNNRTIDRLIAKHIMGLELCDDPVFSGPHYKHKGNTYPVITYSEDIAAAWEVVEKVDLFNIYDGLRYWDNPLQWQIYDYCPYDGFEVVAQARTLPMAICLAALKAKAIELPECKRL